LQATTIVVCHWQRRRCRPRCPHSCRRCELVAFVTIIVAAVVLSLLPPHAVAVDVALAVAVAVLNA